VRPPLWAVLLAGYVSGFSAALGAVWGVVFGWRNGLNNDHPRVPRALRRPLAHLRLLLNLACLFAVLSWGFRAVIRGPPLFVVSVDAFLSAATSTANDRSGSSSGDDDDDVSSVLLSEMPAEYSTWAWRMKIWMIFLRAGKHALRCLLQYLLLLHQRLFHPSYRHPADIRGGGGGENGVGAGGGAGGVGGNGGGIGGGGGGAAGLVNDDAEDAAANAALLRQHDMVANADEWAGFVVVDKSIPVLLDALEALGVLLLYLMNLGHGKLSFCLSDMMYSVGGRMRNFNFLPFSCSCSSSSSSFLLYHQPGMDNYRLSD
jgi:hypothetical protein